MQFTPATSLPGLNHRFSHHGLDYHIAKPFGPNILETQLPNDILEKMLALSDSLLTDPTRSSYGANLVGQIREEPQIPIDMLRQFGVFEYIHGLFAEYILASTFCDAGAEYKASVEAFQRSDDYQNPVYVNLEAAWLVSQQSGEYNPIHNHSLSTLSSVMYLKVPEQLQDSGIEGKADVDGHIEWVYQSADQMQNSTVRVKPVAGRFYIFPASLLHLVYPFTNTHERRSVSINASHRL